MIRKPNELWIQREMAQEVLAKGYAIPDGVRVLEGPDPEAVIIGARLEQGMLIVEYDRPVPEPILSLTAPR